MRGTVLWWKTKHKGGYMPALRHRSPLSGDFLCAIPGCNRHTLRRSNKLCKVCWQEYGTVKPRPEWLRFLMADEERQRYRDETFGGRVVSLDAMLDGGHLQIDELEVYKGAPDKPRKPRRRSHNKRGRPPKCTTTTVVLEMRHSISLSR